MKRALAITALLALVSAVSFAGVTISPGLSFMGFSEPYLTLETSVNNLQSVKFYVGKEGLVGSFRLWPTTDMAWPLSDDTVPSFVGFGVKSMWGDGMAVAGFFAEVGVKLYNTVELGFSLEQFGTEGRIALNLGLSFSLDLGGEEG